MESAQRLSQGGVTLAGALRLIAALGGLFAAGALTLLVLVLAAGLTARTVIEGRDPPQIPFDQERWLAAGFDGSVRWQMKDDLRKSHLHEGMTTEDVQSLLGGGEYQEKELVYRLRPRLYGLEFLVIEFGPDGRVTGTWIESESVD